MLSYSGVLRLVHDLAAHVELRALRIEVEALHSDLQHEMDARGGGSAAVLGGRHFTDRARAEEVTWSDEIVGMPLLKRRRNRDQHVVKKVCRVQDEPCPPAPRDRA